MLARQALQKNLGVIVVDADDSNSGLYRMLGFDRPPAPLMSLAGGKTKIKTKMGQSSIFIQEKIHISDIPEAYIRRNNGLMLVGIGKILQALEGCACPMGVLNREFLKKLDLDDRQLAIVDMEAGVEHFGRGIDEFIDQIIVVVEPSYDSMHLAEKIHHLSADMNKKTWAVLNKTTSDQMFIKIKNKLELKGLSVIGNLTNDPLVFDANLQGNAVVHGKAFEAAGHVLNLLLQKMQ